MDQISTPIQESKFYLIRNDPQPSGGALGLGLTAGHINDEPHDEVMQVETTIEAVNFIHLNLPPTPGA